MPTLIIIARSLHPPNIRPLPEKMEHFIQPQTAASENLRPVASQSHLTSDLFLTTDNAVSNLRPPQNSRVRVERDPRICFWKTVAKIFRHLHEILKKLFMVVENDRTRGGGRHQVSVQPYFYSCNGPIAQTTFRDTLF